MNINCIICSDQFTPVSEVHITQCGHMFHYVCLTNWLERSRSCPQCRNRTTEKNIHKVYFNFFNTEHIKDDVGTLQCKIDNMQFQLGLRDKENKVLIEKCDKLRAQNIGLREEVAYLEEKSRSTDSTIHALQDKISFYKSKAKENDRLSEEVSKLRSKLKEVENVHIGITGTRDEVNEMLRNERNVDSLVLLAATLKKSLLDVEKRKRDADHKAKQYINDAMQYKRECDKLQTSNNRLREELGTFRTQWEEEKTRLKEKLIFCDKHHSRESSNTSLKRIITESPVPLSKKLKSGVHNGDKYLDETKSPSLIQKVQTIKDSDSPYLPVKASNVRVSYPSMMNTKFTSKSSSSKFTIFRQNPVKIENIRKAISSDSVGYNGLGGTSKVDTFPSPKKTLATIKRSKAPAMTSTKLKKLSRNNTNPKLSNFLNISQ